MPRRFAMLLFAAALYAPAARAQQVPDTTFDTRVASPAWPEGKGPRLVVDEAHFEFHTMSGRYLPFANLARQDGFRVSAGTLPFDSASLASVDLLVMANALGHEDMSDSLAERSACTPAEIAAVEAWVSRGGSLLLIADHAPMGSAATPLGQAFGVEMRNAYCVDPASPNGDRGEIAFTPAAGLDTVHAITRGRAPAERVRKVVTFTGQSLAGPPGSAQLLTMSATAIDQMVSYRERQTLERVPPEKKRSAAGRAQGLAFTHGNGRVVVLGEAAFMSAQRVGRQGRMGMNVPGNDDKQFAVNVLNWLGKVMD